MRLLHYLMMSRVSPTGASTIKDAVTSVSRYGCTRGRIRRSSKGESDLAGGLRRPPGSIAGSLVLIKLSYPTEYASLRNTDMVEPWSIRFPAPNIHGQREAADEQRLGGQQQLAVESHTYKMLDKVPIHEVNKPAEG